MRLEPQQAWAKCIALVGIMMVAAGFAVSEWSSMDLPDASDSRLAELTRWVFDDLGFAGGRIAPASPMRVFAAIFGSPAARTPTSSWMRRPIRRISAPFRAWRGYC